MEIYLEPTLINDGTEWSEITAYRIVRELYDEIYPNGLPTFVEVRGQRIPIVAKASTVLAQFMHPNFLQHSYRWKTTKHKQP